MVDCSEHPSSHRALNRLERGMNASDSFVFVCGGQSSFATGDFHPHGEWLAVGAGASASTGTATAAASSVVDVKTPASTSATSILAAAPATPHLASAPAPAQWSLQRGMDARINHCACVVGGTRVYMLAGEDGSGTEGKRAVETTAAALPGSAAAKALASEEDARGEGSGLPFSYAAPLMVQRTFASAAAVVIPAGATAGAPPTLWVVVTGGRSFDCTLSSVERLVVPPPAPVAAATAAKGAAKPKPASRPVWELFDAPKASAKSLAATASAAAAAAAGLSPLAGGAVCVPLSPLLSARSHHTTVTVYTAGPAPVVLVLGGLSGALDHLNSVDALDTATGVWSRWPAMPVARSSHAAAAITVSLDSVQPTAAANTISAAFSSVTADEERVYVFGGSNTTATELASVCYLAVATRVWHTDCAPMSVARNRLAGTAKAGRVYALGGVSGGGTAFERSCEVYDPSTNAWSALPPLSVARMGAAAC